MIANKKKKQTNKQKNSSVYQEQLLVCLVARCGNDVGVIEVHKHMKHTR